jgi:hypothetical protein
MINQCLGQLLSAHQIPYEERDGEFVLYDHVSLFAEEYERNDGNKVSMQGDFILRIKDQSIIESFAIPVSNKENPERDLIDYFSRSDFHVMMSYIFRTKDEQNNYEEWDFQGRKREMVIGNIIPRVKNSLDFTDLCLGEIYSSTKDYIESLKIDPGLNWIRVYIGQFNNDIRAAELLIKNRPVPEFFEYIKSKPFVKTNDYYSYRNFMMIREMEEINNKNRIQSPEGIILEILRVADENPNIDALELINIIAYHTGDKKVKAGIYYGFFQSGLFRRTAQKSKDYSKLPFNDEYWIADSDGSIIEIGKLSDQDWFNLAFTIPENNLTENNLNAIAFTSSESNVLGNAIKNGSKIEDLVLGPLMQFNSTPTEEGINKIMSLSQKQLQVKKKTKWKLW